ncbi:MAG TPA: hypothetical protein VK670_00015 [Silvibacterium sp.]|nr:hypothetical protein [Silvibacterium sp.]
MLWQKCGSFSQSSFVATAFLAALTLNVNASAQAGSDSGPLQAAATSTKFTVVRAPNVGTVTALSAVAEDDIWAVSGDDQSPALHFDGAKWNPVPLAQPSRMFGVAAVSHDDVWAVGMDPQGLHAAIQHFDGHKWTAVPSPRFPRGEALSNVAAVSPQDIFAVGNIIINSLDESRPLIEHFDGKTWKVVPVPEIPDIPLGSLGGLAVISASDIWAVGTQSSGDQLALALHFNGRQWKQAVLPVTPIGAAGLGSVAAVAPNDVWAVGAQAAHVLIEHFDGHEWQIVDGPILTSIDSNLISLSAISATDIWATGCSPCGDGGIRQPALIEHWNGKEWTVNPAPPSAGIGDTGIAILTFRSGDIFVGGITELPTGPGIQSFLFHGKEE